MNESNDMEALSGRAGRLIEAITGAIMSTAEVAAERIELAAQVAAVQQRMGAFSAVLETIAVQREAIEKRLPSAKGSSRVLLLKQIEILQTQELALLEKIGAPRDAAQVAVSLPLLESVGEATHAAGKGKGRGFKRVAALGVSEPINGTATEGN